ncbi:SLC13 family permease [Candidatus Nitrotoga sp. M5]|uniref:SLC13 family permease n=1 Tax=Candidatus Nitrotoga sp. M5 TaxID=2890409 RepID=UPI001EF4F97F|nr:SLC13 family permease [Candidatus Nitrotoga sp. M5]CAH1388264.1 Sodium-dependent dicarboxylate transporter SdcS [Candidatus Nitrotoga sp. M5]
MGKKLARAAFFAGPMLGALIFFLLGHQGVDSGASWCAAVAVVCIVWWIFEPIPIPVTSLLPLSILPLVGVLSPKQVGEAYGSPLILLLLGGFMLSMAMSSSGAHRRVALCLVRLTGASSSRRVVFGFMFASACLSMWISNTATTLMLLPVALAVLERSEDKRLAVPLLLGMAYAASLGGIGTPIGTPPNLIFMQVYAENVDAEIGFTQWMGWSLPIVVLFLPIMGFWLTRNLTHRKALVLPEPGNWRSEEKRVLGLFALTALAWITRSEPFGGWSKWFDLPQANDASVALIAVVVMFLVPNGRGERLLNWETAVKIPWGVLLLFGGGICLAKGFVVSGLSGQLGQSLTGLSDVHPYLMIGVICLLITFLTEATSNTATTTLLMPILAATAIAADIEPAVLMVPAAISASCAFMLPVATAPNSIIFGTGKVSIQQMAREGLALNLIGALVITTVCYFTLTS